MSFTQSRGLTDAGRWTTVATILAEHLDELESAKKHGATPPPPPGRAIEAARHFFSFVLSGIELDKRRGSGASAVAVSRPSHAMVAAGISNLSIAIKVIKSEKPNTSIEDLGQLEREIKSLRDTLERLRADQMSLPMTKFKSLAKFLRELQRQGEVEQDAAVAFQEQPTARQLAR